MRWNCLNEVVQTCTQNQCFEQKKKKMGNGKLSFFTVEKITVYCMGLFSLCDTFLEQFNHELCV